MRITNHIFSYRVIIVFLSQLAVSFWTIAQPNFWECANFPTTNSPVMQFVAGRNGFLFSVVWTSSSPAGGIVLSSIDGGKTWSSLTSGTCFRGLVQDYYGNLYAGKTCDTGVAVRSTDNGISWVTVGAGMEGVFDLAVLSNGWIVGIDLNAGFWRSTDAGLSWTSSIVGGFGTYLFYNAKNNTIYLKTTFHGIHGRFWASTDYGTTWSQIVDYGAGDFTIRYLCVDSTGRLLVLDDSGCLYSGLPSSLISCALPKCRVIQADPLGRLLVGGEGFFISTNGGMTWTKEISGMIDTVVTSIGVTPEGHILAGTYSGQIYRSTSPITDVGEDRANPKLFSLLQNYPNPFNPATTISFNLPSKSFVSLNVFDILGREIAKIVSGEMSAGSYSRNWNPQGLSSGIYFYRLQVGAFTETKKLILLK